MHLGKIKHFRKAGFAVPKDPSNENGGYYYVLIKNVETDPEYVNENITQFDGQFLFITAPQISDFYAIRTRQELTQYGTKSLSFESIQNMLRSMKAQAIQRFP